MFFSVAFTFALPQKAEAVGITGGWKQEEVGTTFIIDGVEYAVDTSDVSYTGKRIEYPAGSGTYYYLVENVTDFGKLTTASNSNTTSIVARAILTADLSFENNNVARSCYGVLLEGNNKTVTFTNCGRGLFHNFSGIIRNLTLTGNINQSAAAAAICAWGQGVELDNVHSSVNVTVNQASADAQGNAAFAYVGGLVANCRATKLSGVFSDNNYSTIFNNCSNSGTVSLSNHSGYAGGLTGGVQLNAKFTNCTNTGAVIDNVVNDFASITQNSYRAMGGLVGVITTAASRVVFTDCTNSGTLTSVYKACGGIVGNTSAGTLTFTNCTNSGAITTEKSGVNNGGIVGQVAGTTITISECSNIADITCQGPTTGGLVGQTTGSSTVSINGSSNTGNITCKGGACGGIVGKADGAVNASNTTNSGTVISRGNYAPDSSSAGGIIGCVRNNKAFTFTNVSNTGNVSNTAYSGFVGGLVGLISHIGAVLTFTGCVNEGDVSTTGALAGSTDTGAVGGIVGGTYAQNSSAAGLVSITIKESANTGDVTSSGTVLNYAGGFVGYLGHGSEASQITVEDSYNSGIVSNASTADGAATSAFIGYTNKAYTLNRSFSFTELNGANTYAAAFADGEVTATVTNVFVNATAAEAMVQGSATVKTAAAFASGEIAYLLNTAKGSVYWYQTLGTDLAPVANNEHGAVYQVNLVTPGATAIGKTYSNTEGVNKTLALVTASTARTEDPSGFIWTTAVADYDFEVLAAAIEAGTVTVDKVGTLIAPEQVVTAAGGLTHAALIAFLESKGLTASDLDRVSFDIAYADPDYATFCGSVVNIRNENKTMTYTGVGYIVIGGEHVYAAAPAAQALAD